MALLSESEQRQVAQAISAVERENTEIRTFPGRIWHSLMYSDMPLRENFEATTPEAEKAPEVKF
ncbi:MAG: hypothetical protein A3J25_11080 [Pseudomonadales bacterium RIFCSPLOWO2_02_FULL_63_210]|nr:MAG: hypothetical protein A3J25_11080 [Pseudomonadales bacterium RIFCSPLOWO2_02_FULL_63_210]